MPRYNISGIDVEFPFEAYPCQLVYMERVIQSLQNKSNALLESPIGTGKTLCLLCATLAWRKSLVPASMQSECPLPTIVYTSRTHSQIQQVIGELKKTIYSHRMVVLGSREQLCIHPEVSQMPGHMQTAACQFLCRNRTGEQCQHYPLAAAHVNNNPDFWAQPMDIEDLVGYGKQHASCPYYMSRALLKSADIVFAPYNYVVDPRLRKSLRIDWEDSVLIFDEAHSLESVCLEAASFDLPLSVLIACIGQANKCYVKSRSRKYLSLQAYLSMLEMMIMGVTLDSEELSFTGPGVHIYRLLAGIGIDHDIAPTLLNTIEDARKLLEEDATDLQGAKVFWLDDITNILRIIFKEIGNPHAQYYCVHVEEVEGKPYPSSPVMTSRIFSWWCFNPGIAMDEFAKNRVGSIILTSGNLSPMDSFAEELRLNFPVRLENPHIVSDNQLWAGIVRVGPLGHALNSSYKARGYAEYQRNLGNSLVNFARVVPDGLLVLFESYNLLNLCIDSWQTKDEMSTTSSTIWDRICQHKLPVVEPRQSSHFSQAIEDYKTKLRDASKKGAVFFAECCVEVIEELDFADCAGRAVIFAGIPFASLNNPKIRLKREFLDQQASSQRTGTKVLTGDEWYNQKSSRAVNQLIGRVIRRRHDHGAIILCDERFALPNHQSQISLRIKPHIKLYQGFGDAYFSLTRFFRGAAKQSTAQCTKVKKES